MKTQSDSSSIADRISVRLDPETKAALARVIAQSGMKCSQALRTLIALGAAREGAIAEAYKAATWREAMLAVSTQFRQDMGGQISSALGRLERPFNNEE